MAKVSSQMDDIAFLICWMESRKVFTAGNWRKRIVCQWEKEIVYHFERKKKKFNKNWTGNCGPGI